MKTRSRYLALAVATAAAVTMLSGCSAQATPESVALSFSQAFMTDNGKLPSEFMCEDAPKDEADGARWTTDLATEVKTGSAGEIDGDGTQIIEAVYERGGQEAKMGIKVNTSDLCVTDAGADLVVNSSESEEPTESTPEPTAATEPTGELGSSGNPIVVASDGSTVIDAADYHSDVYVTAAANASFTVASPGALKVADVSGGVHAETTATGLLITVLSDQGAQEVSAFGDGGFEFYVHINA